MVYITAICGYYKIIEDSSNLLLAGSLPCAYIEWKQKIENLIFVTLVCLHSIRVERLVSLALKGVIWK